MEFYCEQCHQKFEHQGEKKEFNNPIYGPCAKFIAPCPTCGNESNEVLKPKLQSNSQPSATTCANGSCCCMN